MGWTSYYRTPGQTDFDHLRAELVDPTRDYELLAGATVDNVFYAALRTPQGEVTALVVLQQRFRTSDGHNYARKALEERMGPTEARCPARILDLLSPLPDCQHDGTWCIHCRAEIHAEGQRWVSRRRPNQHAEVAGPRCYSGYPVSAGPDGQRPLHAPGGSAPCSTCWARAWRQRCRDDLVRAAAQPSLHTGDTFTVAQPWEFQDGVSEDTFTLVDSRRRRYRRAGDGRLVGLPARGNWPSYQIT